MSDYSSLYALAHDLIYLGTDGEPVYSDHFARLNSEVYQQANLLYNRQGSTPEEEAFICLALLTAYEATIYDGGNKRQHIQRLLDRSFQVLPRLEPSLLKVRLLTLCYSEVYDEELSSEARTIIQSWGDPAQYSAEQREAVAELKNVEDNAYPYEVVEEENR